MQGQVWEPGTAGLDECDSVTNTVQTFLTCIAVYRALICWHDLLYTYLGSCFDPLPQVTAPGCVSAWYICKKLLGLAGSIKLSEGLAAAV